MTMAFSGAYVYAIEIFPTPVRNLGIGSSSMCARISGMAAPFVGVPLVSYLYIYTSSPCFFKPLTRCHVSSIIKRLQVPPKVL